MSINDNYFAICVYLRSSRFHLNNSKNHLPEADMSPRNNNINVFKQIIRLQINTLCPRDFTKKKQTLDIFQRECPTFYSLRRCSFVGYIESFTNYYSGRTLWCLNIPVCNLGNLFSAKYGRQRYFRVFLLYLSYWFR